jgi:O-antigen/teichoic acid export membrane protein
MTSAVCGPNAAAAVPRGQGLDGADSRKGLCAIGWISLGQVAALGLRLAGNLVLARLLAPEVFGILGPALAVLLTLEWFCDLGIRQALVRDPRGATLAFLHTGWWMGLVRAASMSTAMAILAWPMARFYGQPDLAGVLAALALLPCLQALRSPGMPILRRRLNYRALFVDEVGQTIATVGVMVVSAWSFRSVWAIVAGVHAGAVASIVISYVLCPVRPRRIWDREALGGILHLSRQVLVNTLLMALWFNSDRLLGLRLLSLEEMGLYAVAWNLAAVLDGLLNRACDVYFSMLSRAPDPMRRANWHETVCARLALTAMPAFALGVLCAPWIVHLLYDARYAGASIPFALLAARLMLRGLGQVQFQYLLAGAQIRAATAAYGTALLVQGVLLVPLTRYWGGTGLALAALASTAVVTLIQSLLMWQRGQGRLVPFFITLGWTLFAVVLVIPAA